MSPRSFRERPAFVFGAAFVITAAFMACMIAVLSAYMIVKKEKEAERMEIEDRAAREQRYEECLTRTTPEICEIHWVRFPRSSDDSGGGPAAVITPEGKVGIGVRL